MNKLQMSQLIIGKLLNLGGMLERNGNRILMPYSLNLQQFSILFEIAKIGKVKQKDMVNRLLLEKAHVSKVVRKLQKSELITITAIEGDKRSSWLSVTAKGEQIINECMESFEEWNKRWIDAIDEKQLISAIENLTQLQDVFKNEIQKTKI